MIELTRRGLARIPVAARMCALLALLNAVCWSVITPPFQVPDEPDHFAYVQQLAENEQLPQAQAGESFSAEERAALSGLRQVSVLLSPSVHTISSREEQRTLESDLASSSGRSGPGGAGVATSEPPLYYALQTVPYGLGSGGTILERLELMRLVSALMAAFTALFVFLFLREALPAVPWAWTVGGLGVALAPLLGFISGAVNPDAMLFAVSAALFFCLARAFRRGLRRPLALAIGAVIAVGFLTKLNFVGLAPGALLGLTLLARREARTGGRPVYYRLLAPALLVALSPVILYALVNLASGRPALGAVSGGLGTLTSGQSSIPHELGYIWQVYLPPLPWTHNYFGDISTTRQIWFNGLTGLYGWVDTVFPGWVYDLALVPMGLIGVLCVRELAIGRTALRDRATEVVTYAAMTLGLLVLVGGSSYQTASTHPGAFTEPRYFLPMLALWGAVLALAARGAGRRWGPVVGALLVVLILAHDIFSQMQVVARYYG
jgi:4-amino-4-deoxy-L-arabinose transferase-like glycosyltransferase